VYRFPDPESKLHVEQRHAIFFLLNTEMRLWEGAREWFMRACIRMGRNMLPFDHDLKKGSEEHYQFLLELAS
jgi:hypothetical protein